MRIQLVSDLHLEWYPDYCPQAASDADVLILAGDIGSYQAGSKLAGDDFGLGRFSPLRANAPWRRVLYLPGNHEYDDLEFDATHLRLREICERIGIEWLEREIITIEGVRFVGTTLWTDFEALARQEATPERHERALGRAYRAADFYLAKNTTRRDGIPLMAADLRQFGLECEAWLRQALATPFDGVTVAVTHFAPTLKSADPRYGLSPGTAGFCMGLDDLLLHAQLWLHGHLHCAHDYSVHGTINGATASCRVFANPRGYFSKHEQDGYLEAYSIEVPAPAPRTT